MQPKGQNIEGSNSLFIQSRRLYGWAKHTTRGTVRFL